MVRVGNRVFVSVQRLDRPNYFIPTDKSVVVVIDADADTVLRRRSLDARRQAITLTGRIRSLGSASIAPTSRLSDRVRRLLRRERRRDRVDRSRVDEEPRVMRSPSALGGDVSAFAWNGPAHSYAVVTDASFHGLAGRMERGLGNEPGHHLRRRLGQPGGLRPRRPRRALPLREHGHLAQRPRVRDLERPADRRPDRDRAAAGAGGLRCVQRRGGRRSRVSRMRRYRRCAATEPGTKRRRVHIRLHSRDVRASIDIFDAAGRVVRRLATAPFAIGTCVADLGTFATRTVST